MTQINYSHLWAHCSVDQKFSMAWLGSLLRVSRGWNKGISKGEYWRLCGGIHLQLVLVVGRIQCGILQLSGSGPVSLPGVSWASLLAPRGHLHSWTCSPLQFMSPAAYWILLVLQYASWTYWLLLPAGEDSELGQVHLSDLPIVKSFVSH